MIRVSSSKSVRNREGALRHLGAEQLLDREHEGVLLHHRRDVVEAVEVGDALQVGALLDELLGAAVQEADVRVGALDHLAVHLEDEAQHPCAAGCCGPKLIVKLCIWMSGMGSPAPVGPAPAVAGAS